MCSHGTGVPGRPALPGMQIAFKSIYLFARSRPAILSLQTWPQLWRGEMPPVPLGFAGGAAARPGVGKVSIALWLLCERADLFVLPKGEKKRPEKAKPHNLLSPKTVK